MAEMMRDDDLDDENYQVREIYAQFGLAVYLAQVLEQGLINTIMVARLASREFTAEPEYDAAWDRQLAQTMGRLMGRLRPFLDGDDALESDLSRALSVRNHLAHTFFAAHDRDFFNEVDREQMLTECIQAQELFTACDARLRPVLERYVDASDIDRDQYQAHIDRYVAEAAGAPFGHPET